MDTVTQAANGGNTAPATVQEFLAEAEIAAFRACGHSYWRLAIDVVVHAIYRGEMTVPVPRQGVLEVLVREIGRYRSEAARSSRYADEARADAATKRGAAKGAATRRANSWAEHAAGERRELAALRELAELIGIDPDALDRKLAAEAVEQERRWAEWERRQAVDAAD